VTDITHSILDDYDDCEKMTIQINKREMLLNLDRTDFKELRDLHDMLRPIADLWFVAQKFNKAFPSK
jgi:hypothetical protein